MRMLEDLFRAYLQLSLAMTPILCILRAAAGSGRTDKIMAGDRRLLWCVILVQMLLPLASLVPNPITVDLPSLPVETILVTDEGLPDTAVAAAVQAETAMTAPNAVKIPEPDMTPEETSAPAAAETSDAGMAEAAEQTEKEEQPVRLPEAAAQPEHTETLHIAETTENAENASFAAAVPKTETENTVFSAGWLFSALTLVWSCVMCGKILWYTGGYIWFCLRVRHGRLPVRTEHRRCYQAVCTEMGIRHAPRLIRWASGDSPMLYGCFRPVICLPDTEFSNEELSSILRHELIHYSRHDLFWKWLAMAAGSVHWFNPLAQWAVRRFDLITELSCDEAVLAALDDEGRLAYGEAILSILSLRRGRKTAGAQLTTHFTPQRGKTRERILYIINKPKRRRARFLVLTALILSVTAGLVSCQTEAEEILPQENDMASETKEDISEKTASINSEPVWTDYRNDLPVQYEETVEEADITVPLVWTEAVSDVKLSEMTGEYHEMDLRLINGMVIRTYEADENGVTPAFVLVNGKEIAYYDASLAEPYRVGDPDENIEGFQFVSWTGNIPPELEYKRYLLRDGVVMVTDLQESIEPWLPEQNYFSAYRNNETVRVTLAGEPREDGAEYIVWYSGEAVSADTIHLTEKHTVVNDWNCTFIPMDENPDWMLQYRMAAEKLEIAGREKTISIDNSAVRKSHTESIRFFQGSAKTRFYISPDETLAVIITPNQDKVTMDHMILVNLETGEVIRYLENPYFGAHDAWLEKHGVPAEYADYGVEKTYDINGLHAGWTFPDFVSQSDVEWNGDLMYIFHSLTSGDGEILLTGYQTLYLNNWVLSGYQAGETRVPEGTVLTEGMTEGLWIRENLYTDFGFRTEEADVAAMSDYELESHMEEAFLAALGIYELSDISTRNMQWEKTGEPVLINGRSYSPMNNPVFPDYGSWESYVRRVLSDELAEDLLQQNLYVGYSGVLYGQITSRTLVTKFRDNGHTIQRIDEDTIRLVMHLDTIDMETGGVLQTREFPFTYERTEDGWRWTYFKLVN